MKNKIIFALLLAIGFSSCEKYEDFTNDFDYTAVYFAYQKPIRTLFANDLNMEVGVVLGGKRENTVIEEASFRIAPELLSDTDIVGTNTFTLLPSNYYTLSDPEKMYIPEGEFLGTVNVSLNSEMFLADPLAKENTYAIPFLLTETSADSILSGSDVIPRKDYSIVVVKYINDNHGVYYHRGVRSQFDQNDNLVDELSYASNLPQEFIQNIVWDVFTDSPNSLKTNGVAEFTSSENEDYSLILTHENDNSVSISESPTSLITEITDNGDSYFDPESKTYYLNYEYTDANNLRNVMKDTLFFRNDGLKLELWD